MTPDNLTATQLCLACGLCCNGALFKDVKLQSGDDPEQLASLGLPLTALRRRQREETAASNPKTKNQD